MWKRKRYVYHIVYNFKREHSDGRGSMTLYRVRKIKTIQDVTSIKEYLEREHQLGNVIIENWIRLKNAHLPEEHV